MLTKPSQNAQKETSIFGVFRSSITEWSNDDASTWSAALACYAILALAPLAVLALKALTLFTSTPSAQSQIKSITSHWMGGATGDAITEILNRASQPGHGKWATAISFLVAIVSAGGVLAELQQAMNRVWKVRVDTGNAVAAFVKARLLSLMVFAIAAIVLLGSVVLTSGLEKLTSTVGVSWKVVTWGIDVLASVLVATLIFALIYRTLPDIDIEWRGTWVGAAISAALFVIGKYALALYFKYGSPTSAFGAVGSLAAVLIWVYYSCLIIFFGAELTQVYVKVRGYRVRPSEHARWLNDCEAGAASAGNRSPAKPADSNDRTLPRDASRLVSAPTGHASSPPRSAGPERLAATVGSLAAAIAGIALVRRWQSPHSNQPKKVPKRTSAEHAGRRINELHRQLAALEV